MKTIKAMKNNDREIKKRVQALEQEIPQDLENAFLEKLEGVVPLTPGISYPRRRWFYYGGLAAAAAILVVILFFLFPLLNPRVNHVEAGEVWVQSARVEGQPASTFIINPKESDITIVWIEKINNKNGGV